VAHDRIESYAHRDEDPWREFTRFTQARIGLGRAGSSLPTRALLDFQLAHARARDAVHDALDTEALAHQLRERGWETSVLRSAAPDRQTYIQRPDLGRILDDASTSLLKSRQPAAYDAVFIVADGLSACAIERHTAALLDHVMPMLAEVRWHLAPVCVVAQGRVAIGDEIGALLGAKLSVILIGERPGLTAPDSLGIYLTWDPLPGRTNAQRNCISNVRPQGLSYDLAARKLFYLMTAARQRRLSGVELKDEAPMLDGTNGSGVTNPQAPGAD
jgi:ethanolamine ammonia-lyase small subunit